MRPFSLDQLTRLVPLEELDHLDAFVDAFLATSKSSAANKLYALLESHERSCLLTSANLASLESNLGLLKSSEPDLWRLDSHTVTEAKECRDKRRVTAAHVYTSAKFDVNLGQRVNEAMRRVREDLGNSFALSGHEMMLSKLEIDLYVFDKCNKPIDEALFKAMLTVFFDFVRSINCSLEAQQREKLLSHVHEWLDVIVAALLNENGVSIGCHLYILHQVLRLPKGMIAQFAHYLHVPLSRVKHLDHALTVLASILRPVRGRCNFLVAQESHKAAKDDEKWTVLDSEGDETDEDDDNKDSYKIDSDKYTRLKESDVIALLNQVPLAKLFRCIFSVTTDSNMDFGTDQKPSLHTMPKLIALSTRVLVILRDGVILYKSPKWRRLSKMLSRLIRHVLQYVGDQWQMVLEEERNNEQRDEAMVQRVQIEFERFHLRCVRSLFLHNNGWQHLALLDFALLSTAMVVKMFYLLHLVHGDQDQWEAVMDSEQTSSSFLSLVESPDVRLQFEEKLASLRDASHHFLITAMANIATSRNEDHDESRGLVEHVLLDLIHMGFVNSALSSECSKLIVDLVCTVTLKHTWSLSLVVHQMLEMTPNSAVFVLAKQLPLKLFRLSGKDLDLLIVQLIDHDVDAVKNQLTRLIISGINFDNNGSLSLPMAQKLALAILNASLSLDNTMLNLLSSSQHELFIMWVYETLSRLRLHPVDNVRVASAAIKGDVSAFQSMIDFDIDVRMEAVGKAIVMHNDPIAVYIALNTTQLGQSVPEILQRGLGFTSILAKSGRFDHLLEALSHIVPLFLHCSHHLVSNEHFISVLKSILNEDQTLVKRAKELVYSDWPGPITGELANLIAYHMASYKTYGEENSTGLMSLWLKCMTAVPNFNRDRNALFIVDMLLREAFISSDETASMEAKSILSGFVERSRKKDSGGIFSWFSSSNVEHVFESSYGGHFGFYALFMLELEWAEHEDVFTDVMECMGSGLGLEQALKQAIEEDLKAIREALPIYRWSQQIIDTSIEHPLMAIFAQKFFIFFLWRPGMKESNEGSRQSPSKGLGPQFFSGYLNSFHFNKVVAKFKAIADHYTCECDPSPHNENLKLLFNSMIKWLQDESVLNPALHINSLSAALQPQRLESLINRSMDLWLETVDKGIVRQALVSASNDWTRLHFRAPVILPSYPVKRELDPNERMLKRLQSYDEPKLPPSMNSVKKPVHSTSDEVLQSKIALKEAVAKPIHRLTGFAEQFSVDISALSSCACHLSELVPAQYSVVSKELVVHACCAGSTEIVGNKSTKVPCKGAAVIVLKFDESCCSDETSYKIREKRAQRDRVHVKLMDLKDNHVQVEAVHLENIVNDLIGASSKATLEHEYEEASRLMSLGRWLYFHLADFINDSLFSCPPVKSVFQRILDTLGQTFVAERPDCVLDVLQYMVDHELAFDLLISAFTPNAGSTEAFMQIYATVSAMRDSRSNAAFVFLSKMSIPKWLSDRNPRTIERSRLIALIGQVMSSTPKGELLLGLYRKHLMLLATFEYPVHLNEVFSLLLELTENQSLLPDVWLDFINAIMVMDKKRRLNISSIEDEDIFDVLRDFAAGQDFCGLEEVQNCLGMANEHFRQERRRVGLFGIYTKYSKYAKALSAVLAFLGHLRVVIVVRHDRSSADKVIGLLWQELRSSYDAWLTPLTMSERNETSTWIQNMADKPLLPFAPEEGKLAKTMLGSLCSVVNMIQDILPGRRGILSYVWSYYVRCFADSSVPDHILSVVHSSLLNDLNWGCFVLGERDLELMARVLDAFLPLSHAFVGQVFNQTSWNSDEYQTGKDDTDRMSDQTKRLGLVLKIVVKLAAEPQVRQSGRLLSQLRASETWPWHLVDADWYESLVQWYVLSVDCRVILPHPERHPLDAAILSLLQRSSCLVFEPLLWSTESQQKQLMFVRCVTRLLSACSNKHKSFLKGYIELLDAHLRLLLDTIHLVVAQHEESRRVEASRPLINELLLLLNGPPSGPLAECMLSTLLSWLSSKTSSNPLFMAMMEVCEVVRRPGPLAVLSESLLENFFRSDDESYEQIEVIKTDVWQLPLNILKWNESDKLVKSSLDVCVQKGLCLTLYWHLRRQRPKCMGINEEAVLLSTLVDWMRHLEISSENEAKLPLLYSLLLRLCQRQLDLGTNQRQVVDHLINFTLIISPLIRDTTWNLLGVVGLVSQYTPSPRARFLATAIVLLIRSQIDNQNRLHLLIGSKMSNTERISLKSDYDDGLSVEMLKERLVTLKSQKSYLGLTELIDFVLEKSEDKESDFRTVHASFTNIVTDKLYVDSFLRSLSLV